MATANESLSGRWRSRPCFRRWRPFARRAADRCRLAGQCDDRQPRIVSDEQLGAAQGVSYRQDRLYFYGDVYLAKPRVGIIREYTLDLKPTGRDIRLARNGKPLIRHPTGLAWDAQYGCFLGDTVNKVATIYELDWDRALKDGNLDAAVLAEIPDDAATNGCRPEYVTLEGRRLLATADYGSLRPAVRLYDPRRLVEAGRSAAPGVCVATIPCDPFNQNLFWDATAGELTCVENVVAGRGWKLDVFNLNKAVATRQLEQARCARSFSGRIARPKVGCGSPTAARCL